MGEILGDKAELDATTRQIGCAQLISPYAGQVGDAEKFAGLVLQISAKFDLIKSASVRHTNGT